MKNDQPIYDGKALLINLNDDPFLTGKLKHIVKDGMNTVGWPTWGLECDIPIQGIGVVPEHNKISWDEKSGMMFIHPNESPKKNKTYVNGKLLKEDTPLKNGDRILFGNHNMYIVQFPGEKIPSNQFDY